MLGGKELDEKLRNCSPQWLKYENMEQCGSLKVSPEFTEYVDSFKELTTVVLSWGNLGPPPQPRRHMAQSGDSFGFSQLGRGCYWHLRDREKPGMLLKSL